MTTMTPTTTETCDPSFEETFELQVTDASKSQLEVHVHMQTEPFPRVQIYRYTLTHDDLVNLCAFDANVHQA